MEITVGGAIGFPFRLTPAINFRALELDGQLFPEQPVKQRQKVIHIAGRILAAAVVLMVLIGKGKHMAQRVHGFCDNGIGVIQQIQIIFPIGVHMDTPYTFDRSSNGPGFHQAKVQANKAEPVIG